MFPLSPKTLCWSIAVMLLASLPVGGRVPPREINGFIMDVWQTEDGLPDNSVTSIVQSADGYLWIGTPSGLARFDGFRFVIIDTSNLPELRDSFVDGLATQGTNRLWIHTLNGNLSYLESGVLHPVTLPDGLPFHYLRATEDAHGNLVLAPNQPGYDVLTFKDGKLMRYSAGAIPPSFRAESLILDRRGTLWTSGWEESIYYYASNQWNEVSTPNQANRSRASINYAEDGGMLIGHGGELFYWRDGKFRPHFNGQESVRLEGYSYFFEDRSTNLWLVSWDRGLLCLRQDGQRLAFSKATGFPGNWIRFSFVDREGNVWIGPSAGGLVRLKQAAFKTYDVRDGLASDVVTSVTEDSTGRLFVASNPGLAVGETNRFTSETLPQKIDRTSYYWTVLADRQGAFWAGIYEHGLSKWSDGQLTNLSLNLPKITVRALFEDRTGSMWVGTDTGLLQIKDQSVTTFTNGLSCKRISAIAQTTDGDIWVGGDEGGLNRIRLSPEPKITRYTRSEGLPGNHVRTLFGDAQGALWIGTQGAGLGRFKNNAFATIHATDGLPDRSINCIVADDRGSLWLGTHKGIFQISLDELNSFADGKSKSIAGIVHTKEDGLMNLQSIAGHQPNVLKARDGRLWFATLQGLSVVDPSKVSIDSDPPPVVIQQLEVDGAVLELNPLLPRQAFFDDQPTPEHPRASAKPAIKEIGANRLAIIPPGWQRLEIRYAGLCLRAPDKVRFMHKLDGFDAESVQAGTSRSVSYSSLPPGTYRFSVRACSDSGVWSSGETSLQFIVQPKLWQTLWFRSGALGAGVLGFGWFVRQKVKRQYQGKLARLETENALAQERERIARDLHDELGPTVSQIILLAGMTGQPLPRGLDKISENAGQIARTLDQIVWALNPGNDSMESLVTYLCQYAVGFFRHSPVSCRADVPVEFPKTLVRSSQRHSILMAVKEALNNVLKHSAATEVWLRFSITPATWTIVIADNGRGFDSASIRPGRNGLTNLAKRARQWGGTCQIKSESGCGTQVELNGSWVQLSDDGSALHDRSQPGI